MKSYGTARTRAVPCACNDCVDEMEPSAPSVPATASERSGVEAEFCRRRLRRQGRRRRGKGRIRGSSGAASSAAAAVMWFLTALSSPERRCCPLAPLAGVAAQGDSVVATAPPTSAPSVSSAPSAFASVAPTVQPPPNETAGTAAPMSGTATATSAPTAALTATAGSTVEPATGTVAPATPRPTSFPTLSSRPTLSPTTPRPTISRRPTLFPTPQPVPTFFPTSLPSLTDVSVAENWYQQEMIVLANATDAESGFLDDALVAIFESVVESYTPRYGSMLGLDFIDTACVIPANGQKLVWDNVSAGRFRAVRRWLRKLGESIGLLPAAESDGDGVATRPSPGLAALEEVNRRRHLTFGSRHPPPDAPIRALQDVPVFVNKTLQLTYSLSWSSRHANLELYPEEFVTYINSNLNSMFLELRSAGLFQVQEVLNVTFVSKRPTPAPTLEAGITPPPTLVATPVPTTPSPSLTPSLVPTQKPTPFPTPYPTSPSPTRAPSPTQLAISNGAIAAVAIGGLLIIVGVGIYCIVQRQKRSREFPSSSRLASAAGSVATKSTEPKQGIAQSGYKDGIEMERDEESGEQNGGKYGGGVVVEIGVEGGGTGRTEVCALPPLQERPVELLAEAAGGEMPVATEVETVDKGYEFPEGAHRRAVSSASGSSASKLSRRSEYDEFSGVESSEKGNGVSGGGGGGGSHDRKLSGGSGQHDRKPSGGGGHHDRKLSGGSGQHDRKSSGGSGQHDCKPSEGTTAVPGAEAGAILHDRKHSGGGQHDRKQSSGSSTSAPRQRQKLPGYGGASTSLGVRMVPPPDLDAGHADALESSFLDDFDDFKDQNIEAMRSEVEGTVRGTDEMMSQAVTRALMTSDDEVWGMGMESVEIECTILQETYTWMRMTASSVGDRRTFMQDMLNKMVLCVRNGLVPPDRASRTIHECAALLGLEIAERIPETSLIVTNMRKAAETDDLCAAFRAFGTIEEAAVAPKESGFGLVRYVSTKGVLRAMEQFMRGEIIVQDVAVRVLMIGNYGARSTVAVP